MENYSETQSFRQWWLWLLLLTLLVFFIYAVIQQIFLGQSVGDNPMSNWGLGLSTFLVFAFIITMAYMQLKTSITKEHIMLSFGPFGNHKYKWADIRKVSVIQYGFVGYGFRKSTKYGTVFNIGGTKGLQIEFKNNSKVLVGCQKPEELKRFLKSIKKL